MMVVRERRPDAGVAASPARGPRVIRKRRTFSRSPRHAGGAAPALSIVEPASAPQAQPASPAPLSFGNRPAAGRNHVLWLGATTEPGDVVVMVEQLTGYRVSRLWRLSHGGWQGHLPGGESSIRFVDALDRLVVVLAAAA